MQNSVFSVSSKPNRRRIPHSRLQLFLVVWRPLAAVGRDRDGFLCVGACPFRVPLRKNTAPEFYNCLYCFVAVQLSVPLPLQPGMLRLHCSVPLACVGDWNEPEKSALEKEDPFTAVDMLRLMEVDPLGHE